MCLEFIIARVRKRGGLIVGSPDSGSRCLGSRPGWIIVFLSKKPYSHIASLHPGIEMGTSELSGKPDNMPKGNIAMDWHPIKERVVIIPVVFILKKPG